MSGVRDLSLATPNSRYVLRHTTVHGKIRFFVYDTKLEQRISRLFVPGRLQEVWDRAVYLNNKHQNHRLPGGDLITYEQAYRSA